MTNKRKTLNEAELENVTGGMDPTVMGGIKRFLYTSDEELDAEPVPRPKASVQINEFLNQGPEIR